MAAPEVLISVGILVGGLVIGRNYAQTPPPLALTNTFQGMSDQFKTVTSAIKQQLNNKMKGEYILPGMTREEEHLDKDALHRYKAAHGLPPDANVDHVILNGIRDAIKRGEKPVDAADHAPHPPDGLTRKGKPKRRK
jgi:hypothetical protein